ncbi:MAG TPA: hypothetical protein VLA25_04540 [Methylotenera sp.]|nr:hypothetical protein [Methylotenera sp.]
MSDVDKTLLNALEQIELNNINHPAWDAPIICRVEVDLPGWLAQLTGENKWEVYSEDEDETCISFSLRESFAREKAAKTAPKLAPKLAEVTLYHNGYAVVDVEGKALFDGSLTSGTSDCAHLSYFHAESGEPIILN